MTSYSLINETARTISVDVEEPSPSEPVSARKLAGLLEEARRHEAAFVLASRAGDAPVGATAARRLSRTLSRAVELVRSTAADAYQISRLAEATQRLCELLRRSTVNLSDGSVGGRPPWRIAPGRALDVRDGRSHVFGLDAEGRDLQEVAVCGLHVSHSRFIADMRRAQFVDSLIEASDFTFADLRGTLWQRTRVRNCSLREVSLVGAAFNDTMFIDCDLRGANLGLDGLDLSTDAAFIRCDLRDASWCGRGALGFELVDCISGPAEDGSAAAGANQVAARRDSRPASRVATWVPQ